jgi:hypothetical protein
VGPRSVLDAVVKRKIPDPRRESNPRTPIVQFTICTILVVIRLIQAHLGYSSINVPWLGHAASLEPHLCTARLVSCVKYVSNFASQPKITSINRV